jgi:hypothetical protein
MDGRVTGAGRRLRLASPATALVLGVVALLAEAAQLVLEGLSHQLPTAASDIANTAAGGAFVLAFTAVGVVVARRQPRNPMGWLLMAVPSRYRQETTAPSTPTSTTRCTTERCHWVPWRCC